MEKQSAKSKLQTFAVKQALEYLDKDPEKNLPKLLNWVEKVDVSQGITNQLEAVKPMLTDPENNWYKLVMSLWTDIDAGVRKRVFENFIINASMIGSPRQIANMEKYGCNIPWAILMDPTSACNLHCNGCWAAEYGSKLSMDYDTLDSIIRQGQELGTYFYIYSGGEPMVRKGDIIRLCEAHPDCQFLAFTNGTLIDEDFAQEMLRVKNFIPAISIEGFEEATDSRRGAGTFQKVVAAMDLLREKKLPFGVSCCYTSANTEVIGSEEFFDFLIEKGAKFVWLFTFIPVGVGSPTELIASAEQRKFMYDQIRKFRKTKPIFTMDFWNDGEFVRGCIAGGRCYLHINANGDIEPCAFIHYSDSNIHDTTLLEAYQRPLFQAYRQHQPFNENHLRPCPLLDNYGALAEMVHTSGAHSTDMAAAEDVDQLCAKCKEAAERWQPVADEIWNTAPHFASRTKR